MPDEKITEKEINIHRLLSGLMGLLLADLLLCCSKKTLESIQVFLVNLYVTNFIKINVLSVGLAADFDMVINL